MPKIPSRSRRVEISSENEGTERSAFLSPSPQLLPVAHQSRVNRRSIILSVIVTLVFSWWFVRRYSTPSDEELLNDLIDEQMDFDYKPRKVVWQVKHPVIMIPGVFSSGLELWEGEPCAAKYIRHRPWSTLTMFQMMLGDKECWMKHLRLHHGQDPPGIRVRAAQGIEAADWFMPGYWVWARVVQALASIGYDHESLHMAAFDWRLDIEQMEIRDRYFTRLKATVELMVKLRGEQKAVILCHSMGIQIWYYFMQWVTHRDREWVDRSIHAVVSIGGPLLGLVKGIGCVLGETKEIAHMNRLQSMLMEKVVSLKDRCSVFRTWQSGHTTLPIGGRAIWPKPLATIKGSHGLNDSLKLGPFHFKSAYYADDILDLLEQVKPKDSIETARRVYNSLPAKNAEELKLRANDTASWYNPLATALPHAPNMRIYCFYGIGIPTELGYAYRMVDELPDNIVDQWSLDPQELLMPLKVDRELTDPAHNVTRGVYEDSQGDATVSLLSNGFMCAHAWPNSKLLNPSGIKCINKEYRNPSPSSSTFTSFFDWQQSPRSSEHVDIMGNVEVLDDILAIVSGNEQGVESRYFSEIREKSAKIELDILNFK